ncbi:Caspase domain-containing protein [Ancylobacter rudongensis]|uniref:Caspase domain-containing protein n=1 Tax=Ancylobacter rudongensis TaxID=177413 RepID=A0A1G4SBK5_9HYPH|nr:Caspase domain-containing protein [Ancylobacter rudongensis]
MIRLILLVLVAVFIVPRSSRAEERVALVIGNGTYTTISSLRNARSDAALMADTLRKLDFDVVEALDVDRADMAAAVRAFGAKLRGAGENAVGLFYYAGHGVQARGVNYMVPVSASIDTESDLEVEALPTDSVLSQMRDAGNATSIIILDACRNNPFASQTRSATRGLARVSASGGAIVAFSAAPGQVASDGEGNNSPYTAALTKAMQTDGLSIEQVFKRVLVDVETATSGEQVPWVESSLRDEFYFRPAAPQASAAPHNQLGAEAAAWARIRDTDDVAQIQAFIDAFPGSVFADLARLRLEERAASAPAQAPVPQVLAALPPPTAERNDAAPVTLDAAFYSQMQAELNRLGCSVGEPDGVWGRRSEQGLALLRRHADRSLPDSEPDPEFLNQLKAMDGRVCPLSCSVAEEVRGGICVAKTCPSGQKLSAKGVCYTPAQTASKPKPKIGRNCWTLIDEVICD